MKKHDYEAPDILLIYLTEADLIATSGSEDGDEDEDTFDDGNTKLYGGR